MSDKRLEKLESNMEAASEELTNALRDRWPKGSKIQFMKRHGQYIPSLGEVIHHHKAYLRVRMFTEKQHVTDVHFSDVI